MKTKKELKEEYKQRKIPMGVFQIKNIKNISPVILACIMLVALSIIVLLPIDSILIKMSLSDFISQF